MNCKLIFYNPIIINKRYVPTAKKQAVILSSPLGVIPSNIVATSATMGMIMKLEVGT